MRRKSIYSSEFSLEILKSPINISAKNPEKFRIVDLFCGAGGMTSGAVMGASESSMNVVVNLAADTEIDALNIYNENFGDFTDSSTSMDLSKIFSNPGSPITGDEEKYANDGLSTDLLMAGPPCQGHSDLNNSTRRMDPRNELYFVVPRAIELFKPSVAVIENVPGVVHSKENVVNRTKEFLESIGYSFKEFVVDFLDLGIPQTRKRHILVASKDSHFLEKILKKNLNTVSPSLKDWLSNLSTEGNPLLDKKTKTSNENIQRIDYLFDNSLFDLPNHLRPPCHQDGDHSYNSVYGRLDPEKPAQTITSGFGSMGQGRYVHPYERRTITAREAARIQGFPDWFKFESIENITGLRRLIANAVPAVLTYSITKDLLRSRQQSAKT